jgi:hypothetical protein
MDYCKMFNILSGVLLMHRRKAYRFCADFLIDAFSSKARTFGLFFNLILTRTDGFAGSVIPAGAALLFHFREIKRRDGLA